MKQQLREQASRFAHWAAPGVMAAARKVPLQDKRIRAVEARLRELEVEVQECRRLHTRLAELTDVVQELLLPATARDEERLSELLAPYADTL